jgi:hypothetical protein
MTSRITELSTHMAARIAGVGYLLLFVLAIFANFVVREGLIDTADAATTFSNIADSEFLFRMGIAGFLAVFIIDVVIAWALYIVFKTASKQLSLLAGWFRIVYTVFLGVALIFFLVTLQLVSGAGYLAAFDQSQLDAQVMLLVNAFNYAWLIGLAGFGIHLMLLGYLMVASQVGPRILGLLLLIAGSAYVFDTFANVLVSSYAEYETVFLLIVAVPSVVGELAFTIWLLTRAGSARDLPQTA